MRNHVISKGDVTPPRLSATGCPMQSIDISALADILRRVAQAEILPRFRRLDPATVHTKTSPTDLVTEAGLVDNKRIALVGPGVVYTDPGTRKPFNLPPTYLAAAVGGQLASLAPHVSLTNKALSIDGTDVAYGVPAVKTLLGARMLVVRPKFGYQVVKGITTGDRQQALDELRSVIHHLGFY